MKPHEKLGVAIANAGYAWTSEMRSAWEELDRKTKDFTDEEITEIYEKVYEERHDNQVIAFAIEILKKASEK